MARGERVPPEVREGFYVLPGALPVWRAFKRLSRGRPISFMGAPLPLAYRDIRDEAARCTCELNSHVVEDILTELDDLFLELCAANADIQRGNRQHESAGAS